MNCFLNTTPYYGTMVGTSCTANSAGAAEGGCCREVAMEVAGELEGMSRGCRGLQRVGVVCRGLYGVGLHKQTNFLILVSNC